MQVGGTQVFWIVKRWTDLILSLLLLPVLGIAAVVLLILNPWANPGALFFCQSRVGLDQKPFVMVKFRTMRGTRPHARFADREAHRIPPFGALLRRYRIDELPQIVNVLRGEMSLIGPRPEQLGFVEHYGRRLPGYHLRHVVRPGVSGLSQVVQGYTSDTAGTERKLALDLRYIRRCGFRMELYVLWRTLVTVATGQGAL